MPINMKTARYSKFNFEDIPPGKVSLRCNVEFASQIPANKNNALSERAVLVSFKATVDGSENVVLLDVEMRAVFDLDEHALAQFDKEPPSEYCREAYKVFVDKTNSILGTMGIDGLTVPSSIDI